MFVGKSPEEKELAGEEVGVSLLDVIKSVGTVSKSPLGKVLMPKVALATSAVAALKKAGIQMPRGQQPRQEIVTPPPQRRPAPAPLPPAQGTVAGYFVGAEAPMSYDEVSDLIRREPNERKRERMLLNLQRARKR